MTKIEWVGELFLVTVPCLVLFSMFIVKDALRILIFMASSFFWLCSLLLSGMVWWALVPLREYLIVGVICSVLIQEAARILLFYVMQKAHFGIVRLVTSDTNAKEHSFNLINNHHVFALVCNLGFGISSGMFANINQLSHISGPGSIGLFPGCRFFFILSGLAAGGMMLLNIAWGIIIFNYLHTKKDYYKVALPIVNHLFVSCMTLLNKKRYYDFQETFVPMYLSVLVMYAWAFNISGGSWRNLVMCLFCKAKTGSEQITNTT